jgi:hypothetical protein
MKCQVTYEINIVFWKSSALFRQELFDFFLCVCILQIHLITGTKTKEIQKIVRSNEWPNHNEVFNKSKREKVEYVVFKESEEPPLCQRPTHRVHTHSQN